MKGEQFFARAATRPPFNRLHPRMAAFFKDYLSREKVVRFKDRFVLNTHFPPYPSRAFDNLVDQFGAVGEAEGRLYSITLAVTNRCSFKCWHCYNAGRNEQDLPLPTLRDLARQLQDLGAVRVTLTGGEPLLRDDLAEIAATFDDRTSVILGTTGAGLTARRARDLAAAGVFAAGISLDSDREAEHDAMRGQEGAFRIALDALGTAGGAGLYPYVVAVGTRELLAPERFFPFLEFAGRAGALEVHLLEPCATGRLAGRTDVVLSAAERQLILDYQEQVSREESLPILSSFTYLESSDVFGCGAGLTHMYIDGSGEVCPCNLVPMSFGNLTTEPFAGILARMRVHLRLPRPTCIGRILAPHIPEGRLPTPPEVSDPLCARYLPRSHALPRFFEVRATARGDVGHEELRAAYDGVHQDYDAFWLTEAGRPIDELIRGIPWRGDERVFEAGCGTGYATALLARQAKSVLAADLSEGMLTEARGRIAREKPGVVRFVAGDALALLESGGPFDIVFTSWVLGYIPLQPFFAAASRAFAPGGRLTFVVHKENSPREAMEIFAELVAEQPAALTKRIAFDFPRDCSHVAELVRASGLDTVTLRDGVIVFEYDTARQVLEHLLKSGAGTAFYEAVDPALRDALIGEFLRRLTARRGGAPGFDVRHDYIVCVATKP